MNLAVELQFYGTAEKKPDKNLGFDTMGGYLHKV